MTGQTYPSDLKRCFKCGENKKRGEFYAHPETADGLLGKCKECTRADMRNTRLRNLEEYRDRDRKRNHKRTAPRATVRRSYGASREWSLRNREKRAAHSKLDWAVASGVVKKEPCFVCGSARSHGHHEDYSRPLSVVWLCSKHHQMWHRIKREVERVMSREERP